MYAATAAAVTTRFDVRCISFSSGSLDNYQYGPTDSNSVNTKPADANESLVDSFHLITRLPFSRRQTNHEQDTHAFCSSDLELNSTTSIYKFALVRSISQSIDQ